MESKTYKAHAVVEVTLTVDSDTDRYDVGNEAAQTLSALDTVTGGRVRVYDYSGGDAVFEDDGKLHKLYRRAGEPLVHGGVDTGFDLDGALAFLSETLHGLGLSDVSNKAKALRALTEVKKYVEVSR